MTAQTQTTKHTPGPWKAIQSPTASGDSRTIFANGDDEQIASVPWLTREQDERLANAALIAAAPDLLEALGECVSEPGAKCWDDPEIAYRRLRAINDIARAAIARAESRADA